MAYVKNYTEFLTEALHVVKRKYTDIHPQKVVSDIAPVREKVLSFVKGKGKASLKEMEEFLRLMNEETGRKTSMGWVKANSKYFKVKEENGETYYQLSKEGLRIHDKMNEIK